MKLSHLKTNKMSEPLLSRKMQSVYSIAESRLAIISAHPDLVERGALGYFMSIENIEKAVRSFNPVDWYKDKKHNEENIFFYDLPKEDQKKLIEVLKELAESNSYSNLKDNCRACGRLADEFGHKILARRNPLNDEDRKLKELDDTDVPVVRGGESSGEFEQRTGHGFFGNSTTGYVGKKDAG